MIFVEFVAALAILAGAGFFLAGTVGLLRFPDTFCRLHALTKADGLGLALVCLGVALLAGSAGEAARLLLIWLLIALSSATCAHLVARHIRRADSAKDASREARP
jgi:multicomponent Na+:H+ antiporter subunit G